MIDGLDTILWVVAIGFFVCAFFRMWWVAGLVTLGVLAMAWQGAAQAQRYDWGSLLLLALVVGVPAMAGTALGKYIFKRRSQDPFDPQSPR